MGTVEQPFPLLRGVNQNAKVDGPCVDEDWGNVLAHAHHYDGVICVPSNGKSALFQSNGQPTSLFLHEYAHLIVPGGHTDDFWAVCKQLHADYQVAHDRFSRAVGSIAVSVVIIAASIALFLATGWLFMAFGAVLGIFAALPALFDSFSTEQRETLERECGTRG